MKQSFENELIKIKMYHHYTLLQDREQSRAIYYCTNTFNKFLAVICFILLPFFSETTGYNYDSQSFTIVIDAGHGGKDSGALGKKAQEKNIALKIALKFGQYVNKYMPEVRVLYTRTTDEFIPLHERIALANQNNADVFFSIHCNAMINSSAINGSETYVMGLHRANENLEVAKRENNVVLLEQDYNHYYGDYDPNSSEGHIIMSMYQNAYINQSLTLAEKIENQFKINVQRNSRGVKQGGFLVLRTATMPSVLVEAGFLSNSSDETYLNSDQGQTNIAVSMYKALENYKKEIEAGTVLSYSKSNTNTTNSQVQNNNSSNYTPKTVQPSTKTIVSTSNSKNTQQKEIKEIKTPSIETMYPSSSKSANTTTSNSELVFRVQLASSPTPIDLKTGAWAKVKEAECVKVDNSYKCLVGNHLKLNSAVESQNYWRKNGFKDAFVVAFKNGQKIAMSEAIK